MQHFLLKIIIIKIQLLLYKVICIVHTCAAVTPLFVAISLMTGSSIITGSDNLLTEVRFGLPSGAYPTTIIPIYSVIYIYISVKSVNISITLLLLLLLLLLLPIYILLLLL